MLTTGGVSFNSPQQEEGPPFDEFQLPLPPPQRVSICLDVFPKPSTSSSGVTQYRPHPRVRKLSAKAREAQTEAASPAKKPKLRPIAPAPNVIGGGARSSVSVVTSQPVQTTALSSGGNIAKISAASNDKREALCALATQQVEFAFNLPEASEEEKVKLYLKLSQLCSNYIAEGL